MTDAVLDRFMAKVLCAEEDECWEWLAGRSGNGYGMFYVDGRVTPAHRVAYELFEKPIPHGLEIDHLCRNRACVNPAHLEPVTRSVNTQRGDAPASGAAFQLAKTHCPKGHPYSGDNLGLERNGHRRCRACNREQLRLARAKKREQEAVV